MSSVQSIIDMKLK